MPTAFDDLDQYLALPRISGLRLSPDGTWLAASVQALAADGKKFTTSIWRIDPSGGPARQLTRSAEGESGARFAADGSLLFISRRPDPDAPGEDPAGGAGKPALWQLPPDGGEARLVATLPGGIESVEAGTGDGIIVASPVLDATRAGAHDGEEVPEADQRLRSERKAAGISAILHESGIVRFWDSDLGPEDTRLFALGEDADPRDLTPGVSHAFLEHAYAVSPDGQWVATSWYWWQGDRYCSDIALIEVATGTRKVLLSGREDSADYGSPAFSPDGRSLACVRSSHDSPDGPGDTTLVLVSLHDGVPPRDLLPGFDRWPGRATWGAGSRFVYFTADDGGRRPAYQVDVVTGELARLTADDGHYGELAVAPDGGALYALRDTPGEPPTPVRIDLATGGYVRLPAPGQQPGLPGRLAEITAAADDGHPVRGWLVLPEGAGPHPLVLFVHGGPRSSWSGWQWRWNAWLMAARGYAVLMPDPALSTGYGLGFIKRGFGTWGPRPFADLMAITDAAVARDDIDAERTAMMGGSYGGYMANWIAGHTDRFRAIASHASLWAMDQMMATTDAPMSFFPEFADPEVQVANSPHRHVEKITTPMLVIHGDNDYRVPIGEALRLWWDLQKHGKTAKFLYFPDEHHWILRPGNVKTWYATIFAFFAEHVLGEEWKRPELL